MKSGATLSRLRRAALLRQAICILCLIAVASGRPRQIVNKTIPDHFVPLPLDKQKLTGLLAQHIRANSEGFLKNIDIPGLLDLLQTSPGSKPGVEREFPGRFLDASAAAYEYNQDPQLRSLMNRVASALIAELSKTSSQANRLTSAEQYVIARCDLLGLVNYYRVTGETTAFLAARRLADSVIAHMGPTQVEASHRQLSIAAAGLLEPLIYIYRFSGDKGYLDACRAIAASAALPSFASIHSQAEFLPVIYGVNGLVDLYQVTGEQSYLQPGIRGWQDMATGRLSKTGAPLVFDAASEQNVESQAVDACNTVGWLQLTYKLLRITGDQQYGEHVERTLYNQVLAAQDGRNGSISPAVPFNGTKLFSSKIGGDGGRCLLSEAKALSLIPLLAWGQYGTGIAINLYTPGRAFFQLGKRGLVRIYSETNFPQSGSVQLHVEPSGKGRFQFPLRLRVPNWTSSFTVDIADLHLTGRPGESVIVNRPWSSGDTVRITLSMDLHVTPAKGGSANEQSLVLQRGPQVLTLSRKLNGELSDLHNVSPTPTRTGQYQLFDYTGDIPSDWFGDQIYRMAGEYAGHKQDLLLVPFADAVSYQTALQKKLD